MKLTDQEKRERRSAYDKKYKDEHKEKAKAYQKVWYEENKEKIKAYYKKYTEENKEKKDAYHKKYREANKEKIKVLLNAWRLANKEKIEANWKAWYRENKEKVKPVRRAWYEANPGKVAAFSVKRRAAKLQRTVSWSNKDLIEQIYKQAKELSIETGESYHVDHIIPLQGKLVSGLHVETNLQILLAHDNISKSNKFQP